MVSFFKRGLRSDAFQRHEMLMMRLGGECRDCLLTEEQTDADLSPAQQRFGHLRD